ncbi:hypothetical protein [Microbulbifer sp. SAOS-129_SWC]|uniref:hypothetical protein n=1 Tax=Microbulbifer sp. SAOS-129_SWC TaxID=3145235 RepID=UPI003216DCB5
MEDRLAQARTLYRRQCLLPLALLCHLACWTAPLVAQPSLPQFSSWDSYLYFGRGTTIRGEVEGNSNPLPGYQVKLYVSYAGSHYGGRVADTTETDDQGRFTLHYRTPLGPAPHLKPLLFLVAEQGPRMLASAIGSPRHHGQRYIVNERTTVATAIAFAQFIHERNIRGNRYGMLNAVHMTANMADPHTGNASDILLKEPNGSDTSTYRTFNSLSNVVAGCVASAANCLALFDATTPIGGAAPHTVLQALANVARYPAYPNYPVLTDDPLFLLSLASPVFQPALLKRPTNWLLFIKFTGGFYSQQDNTNLMNGPGNIAFDRRGYAWILDNYVPKAPDEVACTGQRLLKFTPWGQRYPGSPYFGGGLSGAGFGITLDPRGHIWVGNFGFESPQCADGTIPPDPRKKIPATHNSVSLFHPSGAPLSPFSGFTRGHISWPQGTVSDRHGNIWVANCGSDSITIIPHGNPALAHNILLPGGGTEPDSDSPLLKPFALAVDPLGRAWVTGNKAQQIYILSPDDSVETVDSSAVSVSWPMGISGDSQGNMWVSSSDAINIPCMDPLDPQGGGNPSIIFYPANGDTPQQFANVGGLTIPWGSAIDGNDSLWVFNFGSRPLEDVDDDYEWPNTGLSHFCGVGQCPPGKTLGDAISPDTGYTSDALDRVTGGGVDPSGNLWLLNNWRKDGPLFYDINPGSNSFVIIPGAAAPVKTPLIGPPRTFAKGQFGSD